VADPPTATLPNASLVGDAVNVAADSSRLAVPPSISTAANNTAGKKREPLLKSLLPWFVLKIKPEKLYRSLWFFMTCSVCRPSFSSIY